MRRLHLLLTTAVFIFISLFSFATEGMWLPHLLEKLNEKEMKSLGMKISAKEIFSIDPEVRAARGVDGNQRDPTDGPVPRHDSWRGTGPRPWIHPDNSSIQKGRSHRFAS